MRKLIICIPFLFLFPYLILSQDSTWLANRKTAGILVEYGLPYYDLPEGYRYHVLPVGGTFYFPLFKAKKIFNMSVGLFPHYTFVWLNGDDTNYEFGMNVRLGFNFSVSQYDMISAGLGCGPHYITVETEKQCNGFIFSDYYLLSYNRGINIHQSLFMLTIEFGYRHISNAGTEEPNRSISSFIFGLGFSKVF